MRTLIRAAVGSSFDRVRWWLGVGAGVATEQALGAAANFVFTILLARWLDIAGYGEYAVGYALLWLVWGFYEGLLLDPAMLFSSSKFRDQLRTYHSTLLIGHALLSIVFVVAFATAGTVAKAAGLDKAAPPWFMLAVAGPVIFLPQLLRGLCRARLQTSVGASGAALYAVCLLAGIAIDHYLQLLSATTAFAVMALASAACALWLIWRLDLSLRRLPLGRGGLCAQIAVEHWSYGRWLASANLLSWMPMNIWYAALPLLAGIEAAAVMRALSNLAQPLVQAYAAAHSILIPAFVQAQEKQRFRRDLNVVLVTAFGSALAFAAAVGLLRSPLIAWLYHGRYLTETILIWPIMVRAAFMGVSVVQSAAMQSLERGDWLVASFAVSTGTIVLVGLPATAIWGLEGAVWSQLLAELTVAMSQRWWLRSSSPALGQLVKRRQATP